jgi:hypothetical protein
MELLSKRIQEGKKIIAIKTRMVKWWNSFCTSQGDLRKLSNGC